MNFPSNGLVTPGLLLDARETGLRHAGHRPFLGLAHVWGAGETWADHIGQIARALHHLGIVEPFGSDVVDDVPIDGFLCCARFR